MRIRPRQSRTGHVHGATPRLLVDAQVRPSRGNVADPAGTASTLLYSCARRRSASSSGRCYRPNMAPWFASSPRGRAV